MHLPKAANPPACRILAALALAILPSGIARALTWTHANTPDENTIALLHFDEGAGTTTTSATGGHVFNIDPVHGEWSANAGWMEVPSGSALKGATGIGAQNRAAESAAQIPLDWSLPAITIRFWMCDPAALQQENKLFYFGYDGWRNQQALLGYRPGFSGAARGMFAGVGSMPQWPWATITDGAWHHVAIVGTRDANSGLTTVRLFIDNVRQNFMADGEPAPEWTFTPMHTSQVAEYWSFLHGCSGEIDEFLIQGEALTDFANGINAPQPPGGTVLAIR